jgi:hypothetical protein
MEVASETGDSTIVGRRLTDGELAMLASRVSVLAAWCLCLVPTLASGYGTRHGWLRGRHGTRNVTVRARDDQRVGQDRAADRDEVRPGLRAGR